MNEIDRNREQLEREKAPSGDVERGSEFVASLVEQVFSFQIADDERRPEQYREGHHGEIEHRIGVKKPCEVPFVEEAPEGVGGVVGNDAEQEVAVVALCREMAFAVFAENADVDDDVYAKGQKANQSVSHVMSPFPRRKGDASVVRVRLNPR